MKKSILTSAAVILFSSLAIAQSSRIKKADKHYQDMNYKEAIAGYKKAIEKEKHISQNTYHNLASSYFNLNDYSNAKVWYANLYEIKRTTLDETTFIKYVETVRASRDYNKANALLKEYYAGNKSKLKTLAIQKSKLDSIQDLEEPLYTVKNLAVNTNKSDFAVVSYQQGRVVFSSARDSVNKRLYVWNSQPFLSNYLAETNLTTGELINVTPFLENTASKFHDATVAFSKDRKTVYFTSNYTKKDNLQTNGGGFSNTRIMKGTVDGNQVIDIKQLDFNNESFSCAHPAISKDGKLLFFVSDMPGGYGGTDIYYVEIFEDGSSSDPINAGANVNTAGREMFPYLEEDVLYFSSDGHYGLGGLDIFSSKIRKTKKRKSFDVARNLGEPINSNMDDFSYMQNADGNSGYFSSNRTGGKGDDDIYYFKKNRPDAFQIYSGYVYDKNTNEPLSDVAIEMGDEFDDDLSSLKTNKNGYYELKIPIDSYRVLLFSKGGYGDEMVEVESDNEPNKKLYDQNIYLTRKDGSSLGGHDNDFISDGDNIKIDVEPIYFDLDRYNITPRAASELNKVVNVMNRYSKIRIRIEAHTDSRGSNVYNLALSDNRAKATMAYLIQKGIAPERIISAVGYGESRLKVNCPDKVNCPEELHAINRRSDFIIVNR